MVEATKTRTAAKQKVAETMLDDLCCFTTAKCESFLFLVEVHTHYSKRARHYLEQYEAIQTALNHQPADTTPTHSAVAPPAPRQRYRLADRLGADTLDQLVARYEAGEPTTKLATEFGIAKSSLLRLLEARGVAMRNQRLTPKQQQHILRLRQQGTAIRTIAAKVGCSYGTAQAFLKTQSNRSSR